MREFRPSPALWLCALGYGLLYVILSADGAYLSELFAADFPPGRLTDTTSLFQFNDDARPFLVLFGALAGGLISDRRSRGLAVTLALALGGLASLGFALSPTYLQVGSLATDLYFACVAVLNIAFGAAVAVVTVYAVEAAPADQRARYCGLLFLAAALGGFVVTLAMVAMPATAVHAAAASLWRSIFLLSAVILIVAVGFRALARRALPVAVERPAAAFPWGYFAIGALASCGLTMLRQLWSLTTFETAGALYRSEPSFALTMSLANFAGAVVALVAGAWLADRIGRRRVVLVSFGLMALAALVAPALLAAQGTLPVYLAAIALFAVFGTAGNPALNTALVEGMPERWRATGLGCAMALGVGVQAHLVPRGGTMLTNGDILFEALVVAVGIGAMFFLRETAPAAEAGAAP